MPTLARFISALAVIGLLALGLSNWITEDADFSINAATEVFTVEPECGQELVWDLPPGRVGLESADAVPTPSKSAVSIAVRGGARARVRVARAEGLLVDFGPSLSFGCGVAVDVVTFSADGRTAAAGREHVAYHSAGTLEPGAMPVLLLKGRVVVGQEISFGAGTSRGRDTPLLLEGRIEARTPDRQTGQRKLIHEEQVDAGSMIDSHACLDVVQDPRDEAFGCVRRSASKSEGFVRLVKHDDEPALDLHLAVAGRQVGVRQQGGAERHVLITTWSRLLSSTMAQLLVAMLALVGAIIQLWGGVKREKD
jgi:hypothetical protein